MSWQVIVALVIAVPVVMLPVAFVWFLNTGGVLAGLKARRAQKMAKKVTVENGSN